MKQNRLWFLYAMLIVVAWGIWGAWSDYPSKPDPQFPMGPRFPMTLVYVVWALTLIPPSLVALRIIGWKPEHDRRSLIVGIVSGTLGAVGQLILFKTLELTPPYLLFPFIALSPVVTIVMALIISRERATLKGWLGIALAVLAGVLLSVPQDSSDDASKPTETVAAKSDQPPAKVAQQTQPVAQPQHDSHKAMGRFAWVALAILILLAWGIQGFLISHMNKTMRAESIFFYMMLTGVMLIPIALLMTDFSQPINWGFKGPYLAAAIQILNSVGALLLVYAFRFGKAIIISPLTNAGAPVVTVILSLTMAAVAGELLWTTATTINVAGITLAVVATVLMAIEGEKAPAE